jgi:hypothetical protein
MQNTFLSTYSTYPALTLLVVAALLVAATKKGPGKWVMYTPLAPLTCRLATLSPVESACTPHSECIQPEIWPKTVLDRLLDRSNTRKDLRLLQLTRALLELLVAFRSLSATGGCVADEMESRYRCSLSRSAACHRLSLFLSSVLCLSAKPRFIAAMAFSG